MFSSAFYRFLRVIGGQALGAGIMAALNGYQQLPELQSTEGVIAATIIGSVLTALDKYLREKGVYRG
jgi:tetrahydromethanopterin S-methyltransferase subunit C